MKLTPEDVGRISAGIVAYLSSDVDLQDVTMQRSERINKDPAKCPWLGVYRVRATYPSRTLGAGSGFRQQKLEYILIAQAANGRSGQDCEETLELLVRRVLSALLSDPTLNGLVQTFEDLEVRYPSYQQTASNQYMQTALIYVTFIGGIQ